MALKILFSPIENPRASSIIARSSVLAIEESTSGIKTGISAFALTKTFPSVSTPLAFCESIMTFACFFISGIICKVSIKINAAFGFNPFFSSASVKVLTGVIKVNIVKAETTAVSLEVKFTAFITPSL